MCNTGVIIVAGGNGSRMGGDTPKQFLKLGGKEIIVRSIERFAEALPECRIAVVLPEGCEGHWQELLDGNEVLRNRCVMCIGGETRFESVKHGLRLLDDCEIIAVHDAVRPLVSKRLICDAVEVAVECGAAVPVTEPVDSFRILTRDGAEVADRRLLRAVQTPQVFNAEWLREAYKTRYNERFTDDASVVERAGHELSFCEGDRWNIKITLPDDLAVAEALVQREEKQ